MDRRIKIKDWIKTGLAFFLVLLFSLSLIPRLLRPPGGEAASFQAAPLLAQAAQLFSGSPYLWRMAGRAALEDGDQTKAIQYFSYGGFEGLSAPELLALGAAFQQAGDLQHALLVWEKALAQGADPGKIYRMQLEVHRAAQDYPAVLDDLQALLRLKPDDHEIQSQAALLEAALHPVQALPLLDSAAGQSGETATSAQRIARAIRAAIQTSPDPAYLLLESGRALASVGAWEMAVIAFDQSTQERPAYAEAWAYLGMARRQAALRQVSTQDKTIPGDLGLAELQKAYELDPASVPAAIFLANYWQKTGDIPQARSILQQAVDRAPLHPLLQVELGNILAEAGELENALHSYQQAVALAPQDATYYRFLAEFSLSYKYLVNEIALPAARRAVILDEYGVESQDVMAQVLIQIGDLTNAERFLSQALGSNPDFPPALLHLGTIYLLRGDIQAAYKTFNRIIALDPGSAAAAQAHKFLKSGQTSP